MRDNLRHVDVAILHGLGQTERAQWVARKLTGRVVYHLTAGDGSLSFTDADVERFRLRLISELEDTGDEPPWWAFWR